MPRPRTPSRISDSLHQRLNSYALAASAAGVSLLALTQPAEGKIVYTKTFCRLGGGVAGSCPIDLTHNGNNEFAVRYFTHKGLEDLYGYKYGPGNGANMMRVIEGTWTQCSRAYATALQQGKHIGPKGRWCKEGNYYGMWVHGKTSQGTFSFSDGEWKNTTNRYLALRFVINDQIHFGWARCRAKLNGNGQIEAALTGYAYETIPNKPIIAGKTKGKDVITVQAGSLGHLARGASAIPAWRGAD
jgi:hypothetical protein